MLDDVLRAQDRISSDVRDLDYFAEEFCKMIATPNENDQMFNEVIVFNRTNGALFDIAIAAHHRKFLLKYSHVLLSREGQPELFGNYKLLELSGSEKDGDTAGDVLLSFNIDPEGGAIVEGRRLLCAPNPVHQRDHRRPIKSAILHAIRSTMIDLSLIHI